MSMYTLIRNSPKPTMKEIETAFQGNLCRCTGYRAIIEGYRTFTEEWEQIQKENKLASSVCGMGEKCCRLQNGTNNTNFSNTNEVNSHNGTKNTNGFNVASNETNGEALFKTSEFTPYHPSQEPIFPPELKLTDKYDKQYLEFKGTNVTWHRPTSLKQLLNLKNVRPDAKIVVGNTEVGVEMKFKHLIYPVIIQTGQVPELIRITENETGVTIGAAATLNDVEIFLRDQIKKQPDHKTRIFVAMVEMLNWFAGKQIRSVGALGSNIMTGSPISDMIPILMVAKSELEVQSKDNGIRKVVLDNSFFVGYRKNVINPDEILLSIHVPFSQKDQYFQAYKQARRREDDIAIVNAAVNVTFEPKSDIISNISFGFGGMSFKTVAAPRTEEKLRGMPWNRQTLEIAYSYLLEDLPLEPGAPGGMIQYRRSLTLSLFFKTFLAISQELQKYVPNIKLDQRDVSGIRGFHGRELKSSQYFTVVPSTQEKTDALHRPIVHMSAYKQACGEAVYCDDIPYQEGELYCAFVLSTKPHANILKIDETEALAMEGVHGFVSAYDISEERNWWGTVVRDEKIFYTDKVTAQYQVIGLIVAENQNIAQRAARKVRVKYQELEPVIVSIEDAIKHRSYFADPHKIIRNGDIDEVLKEAPHVLEGECRIGGQEHFYLETQSCLVVPKPEDGEMEIYSSTQSASDMLKLVAEVLGIQQNKIVIKVKRVGGAFGGKESKAIRIAVAMAVAARKFNRPVRCMLDRDEDIIMTGARHPFLMKYKVAFNENGKLLGCDAKLYNNSGYAMDVSPSVMEKAMAHFVNSYKIPVVRVAGYPCKTNLPSNTAFRGFGAPQGMYLAECMAQHIADYLNKDPREISELNLYKEGDTTHYNQKITNCTIDKCWKECIDSSNYYNRRIEVDKFNRENRYKKRGLCIIPTMYGIAYPAPHLNQGGALILVYTDGSVLLSHGGIEMGQGLYTKMIQVASRALEIPIEKNPHK
ncbi:hypothetical protein NQ314_004819 [Rhamnusium bicolor]|uniref:FAD-binding PCMH-type domain-containing protein n=1 Tax=Rhamnusium bicolor TaxID=1586634 RepID=A0AAV8ZL86_9CUCU|nr:hypothetical protein NQ314_004819 [Rhamnusium bicolor]